MLQNFIYSAPTIQKSWIRPCVYVYFFCIFFVDGTSIDIDGKGHLSCV